MGVFMNFIQTLIYFQLSLLTNSWICMIGIFVNIGCIISCIMPMGTSDGYQVLAIILGIEEARWKALTTIGEIIKKPTGIKVLVKKREDLFFIIYILIAYIVSILGCIELLKSILHFLNLLSITNIHIFILIILIFGISMILNIVKLSRSVGNIK